jgi:organic radical activating enzyme
MNIILTTDCQRKCECECVYCFAKDNINNPMQFTMENFKKSIDWIELDKYNNERIALLGGEPTLHPNFIEFLKYLLPKKLGVLIFTNAMVKNENFYSDVISVAIENNIRNFSELGFCVNINEPKYRNKEEDRLQDLFFKHLGKVSSLSFNIFEEEFDPYFLISTIKKYNLVKNIRLGIAVPLRNKNKYLKIESYKNISTKIMEFIRISSKYKIFIVFDCGFIRCMFSEKDLQELNTLKDVSVSFDCGPSIDIYPNLEVASCYPMSDILKKVKMVDYTSMNNLIIDWEQKLNKFNTIYDKCKTCNYLISNECGGGCKAYNYNG